MVFTNEQDRFIVMAHFRSATQAADGSWSYSVQSCIRQFTLEYPNEEIQYETFVQHRNRLVQRFMETGSVAKRKPVGNPHVLTVEAVNDISDRMTTSPNKSIRKLSAQTGAHLNTKYNNTCKVLSCLAGISYGSCRSALKKHLHMLPYKVTVHQQLFPRDFEQRRNYCLWFNEHFNQEQLNITFFSDEAWFHLSGYINSQNYRTWATENPHVYKETVLHPIKIGVWIAMSRRRIMTPIFFNDTVNAARYREIILEPFINELHDDELQNGYFQQDGATPHTANATITYLEEYFDNRLISRGQWPAHSPDLTPLDFFLFGYLKNVVFRNPLHTLDELKNAIIAAVNDINEEVLANVFANMQRRINLCLENDGGHFEHLL